MSVCEIVRIGPSQRLARGSNEVAVRCPVCRNMWLTSERHARRIGTGEFTGNCDSCKRPPIKITETHLRYWLLLFGANLQGRTAAVYVREEGLPAELVPIAAELVDFMDALGIAA